VQTKKLPSPPDNPGVRDLVRQKREWSRFLKEEDVKQGFGGWHERGYMPHRDEPELVQFVTFRLADAIPKTFRAEWEALLKIEDDRKRRIELEAYLDKGQGECHLRHPEIAEIVEDSLRFRHEQDYELRAWVIMPNHVHLLFKVFNVPMSQLVDAWKGFTAKQANKVLGRRGKFWQDDYWDTFMRDKEHEGRTRKYIEANPIKAGLMLDGDKWPWGSERFRDNFQRLCLPD
jgi:putative transposase